MRWSAALVAAVLMPGLAAAEAPDLRLAWSVDGATTDFNWADGVGTLGPPGEYRLEEGGPAWTGWIYSGELAGSSQDGGEWQLAWVWIFDDDVGAGAGGAIIVGEVAPTNNDPVQSQTFSLLVTLPVAPVPNPLGRGSIGGTVTDITFDDANIAALPDSHIYAPRIDGSDQPAGYLLVYPFICFAPGPLQGCGFGDDFGIPSPVPLDEPVNETIAISLEFELSPGDSASLTGVFEVLQGVAACPGDFDGDRTVGGLDFLLLLELWGPCPQMEES